MKVVLAFDMGEDFVRDLRASFPQITFAPAYTVEEQLREIPDAEVQFGQLSGEAFQKAGKLRWFQFIGAGFDYILRESPELVESDVVMTNAPGTHAIAMADHAFAMVLAFAHRVPELIDDQRAHRWDIQKYRGRMMELPGTTMGIVAMGEIGKAIAQRAPGFGMDVYAVDVRQMDPPFGVREVWGVTRLDDLLAVSDWFVVTAPRTDATRGMIGRREIERLKPGAHVIALSRGGIIDEEALVDGLRSGQVAGAALDVASKEPLPSDSPLWDMPNVLISPHVSADSSQIWERRQQIFKENLRRYVAGQPLLNVCDKRAGF